MKARLALTRPSLSLKSQLRIGIVTLVTLLVFGQGLVSVRIAADTNFTDAIERAQSSASQVRTLVEIRVNEQTARVQPPPANLDETVVLWERLVEEDIALPSLLEKTMANEGNTAVEIMICNRDGRVLASSSYASVGQHDKPHPSFNDWRDRPFLNRIFEVFSDRQTYEEVLPLGAAGGKDPALTIRVVVSSVLLWDAIRPQITYLIGVTIITLLLSMFLAALYSNHIVASLARLSERIEALASGTYTPNAEGEPSGHEAKEFAAVQSKLDVLGRQFQGAREDVVQMRSGIEQMLERLAEAVLLFGPQQRLISASHSAEQMLFNGQPAEGKLISELFPAESAMGAIIGEVKKRGVSVSNVPVNFPPLRLLANVELLNLAQEGPPGLLVTLRDADTRHQLRTQLDFSTRLAAISRLTGGVAHEIKNPLNAIALHLEILRSRLEEFPDMQPEVEVISSEISRLDRVVKTFLDFTRPVDLQMRTVDMPDVVRQVAALIWPEANRSKVTVDVEIGEGDLLIRADEDLLKQALLNVVANGIDSMAAMGSVASVSSAAVSSMDLSSERERGGRLVIRLERSGDDVLVSVQDEGSGIPDRVRDKIFNLYFTTKATGSGIGLAMTFRIVQLLNGSIDFSTATGLGTTFRMRFPGAELPAGDATADIVHQAVPL